MDKNLENKLNQILEKVDKIDELSLKVDKIDELSLKVDKIDKKLEDYIDFSSERMTKIEDAVDKSKEEVLSEIQKTKLELIDRHADKEKVMGHETRITNLEEKVFTN
ncbi:MAG: hypothetical protein R3B39_02825 [Candidatus Paceibacterota bacterium]